jgi:demethylmenaquinone methyltransferase/2-methoxy-6-polyprenyl-1,4-benzoquinol methylase
MKWLETTPASYDRGIQLLTLNKLQPLKEHIASQVVRPGERVLEIGCGTGTLAVLMARRGARVTGVDVAPLMLAEARRKVAAEELQEQVDLIEMDASALSERLAERRFDVIVGTLVLSELAHDERRFVLDECRVLLAPGGRLVIADEVVPPGLLSRLLYYLVRLPLVLLTWLLTRTTTHPLRQLPQELAAAGFEVEPVASCLAASLQLFVARPAAEVGTVPAREFPRLRHRVNWRTVLIELWCLFFRILPPYPKRRPGLYRVGEPGRDAPVLLTGNYELTVRRVVRAIEGRVDAWLLVADSAGINVWCAAGGGHLNAEKVIAAVKTSGVIEAVERHVLILPQLAANGVDGWKVRQETHWGVRWGPVRAQDIPAYLDGQRKKSDAMRRVTFPLKERLEMTVSVGGFYALLGAIGLGLFWRSAFWPVMIATTCLSLVYGAFLPWLPGRDGLYKGLTLAVLAVAGTLAYSALWASAPPLTLVNRCLGLGYLAFFVGGEFQGMSPLMRGEQGNWGIEAAAGVVVLAVYLALPHIAGLWGW